MTAVERLRILLGWRSTGLVLAVTVGVIGRIAFVASPLAGAAITVIAGILFLGASYSRICDWRSPPAPGDIHEIDGLKVHILAEGEAGDCHPIIWVAGGHGEGLLMHHLHKEMRNQTRSILFDRTGSGWTDPARATVTFPSEVLQLKRLLERADENGPFVLAGHSFGGLFSANFAHHYPEMVAGVVLLDPTPPWNVAFAGKLSFAVVLRKAWWGALATHFGLHRLVEPEIDDPKSDIARELADVAATLNWHSVQPKSLLAEASIFQASMDNPLDLVIGDEALGDLPLLLMTTDPTEDEQDELRAQVVDELGLSDTQADNLMSGLQQSINQQLALSSASRHHLMPIGATHMFPYEYPEIVIAAVSEMVKRRDLD